jgi:hypothetical protein
MRNGKARPQHRPVAPVKAIERERRAIVECLHNAGANIGANALCIEVLTLEIEIGNLIQRIDSPQPCVELDAVNDLNPTSPIRPIVTI